MKRLKLLTTISLGLLGGGLLTSIPLISTSCGDKLSNQTISGDKAPSSDYGWSSQTQYNTTATTTPTWSATYNDGALPNGV
ncbi:MAG: hypothetical protein LBT17_02675, partial [Mycoplasmataceae bacterium]|nr:hypothetical protein [Mycoplasmataceae bacterium]